MFKKIQTLPRHFKNNFSNSSTPVLEINNFQNDNEKMSSNERLSSIDNGYGSHKIIGTSTLGRKTIIARKSVANYYDKHNGSIMSLNSNRSESGFFTDSIKSSNEKINRASILNMSFTADSDVPAKNSSIDSYNDDNSFNINNNNNINNNINDNYQPLKTNLVKVKHSRAKSLKNIISGAGIKRSQTTESINVYGSNGNLNSNDSNNQRDDIYSENRVNLKKRYDNFFLTNEPPDEQTINNLFERIMDETGIDEVKRNYLRNQSTEIKWNMIKAKYLKELNDSQNIRKQSNHIDKNDKSSPEYFIKYLNEFLNIKNNKSASSRIMNWGSNSSGKLYNVLQSLRVSIRNQTKGWVHEFVNNGGLQILIEILNKFHNKSNRKEKDLNSEAEIIKCIKYILNDKDEFNKVSNNYNLFLTLCQSLDSSLLITRTLIIQILTCMCIFEYPVGCNLIMDTLTKFESIKQKKENPKIFNTIIEYAIEVVESRGAFGSMVGARRISQMDDNYNNSESSIMDYVLYVFIFFNTILDQISSLDVRIHIRNQMMSCGMTGVIKKLHTFAPQEFPEIMDQLINFEKQAGMDNEEYIIIYKNIIDKSKENSPYKDEDNLLLEDSIKRKKKDELEYINSEIMRDPVALVNIIKESFSENTLGYECILSILQHLALPIKLIDEEKKMQYFDLIDTIISHIVLNNKGLYKADFFDNFNFSLEEILNNYPVTNKYSNNNNVDTVDNTKWKTKYDELIRENRKLQIELVSLNEKEKSNELIMNDKITELCNVYTNKLEIIKKYLCDKDEQLIASLKQQSYLLDSVSQLVKDNVINADLLTIKNNSDLIKNNKDILNSLGKSLNEINNTLSKVEETKASLPPPPPPPPSSGAIPPPPPLPPMDGKNQILILNAEKKPQKYYPNIKMKFVEWEKIPKKIAMNSYIWNNKKKNDDDINGLISELKQENSNEDEYNNKDLESYLAEDLGVFNELESLFSRVQAVSTDKNSNNAELPEKKPKEEIEIIDNNKARNMMITLSMATKSCSLDELCNSVLTMNESIMTPSKVKQLVQHIPQPEEIKKMKAFKGETDKLRLAEKFILKTMQIPNYEQRMQMWEFKNDFNEVVSDLDKDINTVLNAIQELKDSEHLPKLLELILAIGNFMNGETIKGGAYGFKISSINKLSSIKSNDRKTTLLNYITNVVQNKFPEILNISSELSGINDACRISINVIKEDVTKIRATLKKNTNILNDPNFGKKIKKDGENDENSNSTDATNEKNENGETNEENNDFVTKMKAFFEMANKKFIEIEGLYKLLEKNNNEITESFGEQNIASEDFFGIFKTFLLSFNKSIAENERIKKRNELLEMRKQRENELRKLKKKASETNTNENDSGQMIDMVLETLKNRKTVNIKKSDAKDNESKKDTNDLSTEIKNENEKQEETVKTPGNENNDNNENKPEIIDTDKVSISNELSRIAEDEDSDNDDNEIDKNKKEDTSLLSDTKFDALDWKNFKFGDISIDDFFKSDYFLFKNLNEDEEDNNEKDLLSSIQNNDNIPKIKINDDNTPNNEINDDNTSNNKTDVKDISNDKKMEENSSNSIDELSNSQSITNIKNKIKEEYDSNMSINDENDSNLTLFKSKESMSSSQYNSTNSINKNKDTNESKSDNDKKK